jgi:hypothetical protein
VIVKEEEATLMRPVEGPVKVKEEAVGVAFTTIVTASASFNPPLSVTVRVKR